MHGFDELLGYTMLQHILRNFFVVSRQVFQAGHIVRVGNEPDIHDDVRLLRHTLLESEGLDIDQEGVFFLSVVKQIIQLGVEFRHLQEGCIDNIGCLASKSGQHFPLLGDDLVGNRGHAERMHPPVFLVPADQCLIRRLNIQDLTVHPIIHCQLTHDVLNAAQKLAAPDIDDESRFRDFLIAAEGKIDKIFDQGRRHVIDAVVVPVLKPVCRLGFSCPGKACDDDNLHTSSLSFTSVFSRC